MAKFWTSSRSKVASAKERKTLRTAGGRVKASGNCIGRQEAGWLSVERNGRTVYGMRQLSAIQVSQTDEERTPPPHSSARRIKRLKEIFSE